MTKSEWDKKHDYADKARSRLAGLVMGFVVNIADNPLDNPDTECMRSLCGRHIERLANESFATDIATHDCLMDFAKNMQNGANGQHNLEGIVAYLLTVAILFARGGHDSGVDEQISLMKLLKGAHYFIEQWSGKNRAHYHHAELTQILYVSNYARMFASAEQRATGNQPEQSA